MHHVFISYAKADAARIAKALYARIQGLPDFVPWMDTDLTHGAWSPQIAAALDKAQTVVVLISPDVLRDPNGDKGLSFVRREIAYAQSRKSRPVIIPLLVNAKTELPIELQGEQYIAYYNRPTRREGWPKLEKWLKAGHPPPPAPPSTASPPPPPKPSWNISKRWRWASGIATLIMVILAALALYPDDARRDALEGLGLLEPRTTATTPAPSLTVTLTPTATLTETVKPPSLTPTIPPTSPPAPTLTLVPSPTAEVPTPEPPTPLEPVTSPRANLTLLYATPNDFTLLVDRAVSLQGLRFEWSNRFGELQVFALNGEMNTAAAALDDQRCMQFYVATPNTQVPNCNGLLMLPFFLTADQPVFWAGPHQLFTVMLGDTTLGICSLVSGIDRCDLAIP